MTPKEFRKKQEFQYDHFFNLTSTGISPNYDNIEKFAEEYHQAKLKLLGIGGVSHSTTPNYLDDKYEVKWLINNTYQVEQNGNCVYQGSESDCNEWLKCQLGYCG